MKITTNVRYAVRVMLDLAQHNEITPVSSMDIATRQEISKSYVDNLLNSLKNAGLVRSIRGAGGGFALTRPASQIKVSDIWIAMEGAVCLVDCVHHPENCKRYDQCVTREIWQDAEDALLNIFESWTIEDIKVKTS